MAKENKKLLQIRDTIAYLDKKYNTVNPSLQAMNEKELIALINRYDTNEPTAIQAYDQLRRLDAQRFPDLPDAD